MNKKAERGQFFTIINPFDNIIFKNWLNLLPKNIKFIEPFAGSNNIVKMIKDMGYENEWSCYDISPSKDNVCPEIKIKRRNMLSNYPKISGAVITNPPYLAKNSATRMGLNFPKTTYDDLYKISLENMLKQHDFVAAIIPESFFTQNLFHERLYAIISLTDKIFNDTNCPVCLTLFIPTNKKKKLNLEKNDFNIYEGEKFLGKFNDFITYYNNLVDYGKNIICYNNISNWSFNEPNGEISLFGIDNTYEESIFFDIGEKIENTKIKNTSRGITKIKNDYVTDRVNRDKIIELSNNILKDFREKTCDIFLTCFRGLRKDKKYRRRLDFKIAKAILTKATIILLSNNKEEEIN